MSISEPEDIVIGGGISGIAAAVALADAGRRVVIFEKRPFLGGRATSFLDKETGEEIDNCQHVVLGCCTNVLDLFEKLGVGDRIEFSDTFNYVEPDGRRHVLRPVPLPAPLHYLPSLLRFGALSLGDRLSVIRALITMTWMSRTDLQAASDMTMTEWLATKRQSAKAIKRFWEPVLVSAVNEHLDRACALPCLQVFLQGFLPHRRAALLGIPTVGLHALYSEPATRYLEARGSRVVPRAKIKRLVVEGQRIVSVETATGESVRAGNVVAAIPADALAELLTDADIRDVLPPVAATIESSPITGIHLWFDRVVFDLPHAMLLDTMVQWVFPKPVSNDDGRARGAKQRLQLVVSASRALDGMTQADVVEAAVKELAGAFNAVREAELVRSLVVREPRATFSISKEVERHRPYAATRLENLVLAGDWTRSGWPATLEGSVRSGRMAVDALLENANPTLIPDLERSWLAALALWRTPKRWPSLDAVR